MRLRVVGPFRGTSGYDRHTRELVRQLVRMGTEVELVELAGWSRPVPEYARDPWFDALAAPVDAETTLHFTMPTQVRAYARMRNVNFTMFEADRIPASWAACAASSDLIVVPTASSRSAWEASGVPEAKLRVAPLGVDSAFFSDASAPLDILAGDRPLRSYRYRFLNVAEATPRKNHLGLLRAWIRATSPSDDAVLVIKTNASSAEGLQDFTDDIRVMLARLGRGLDSAARVVFVFDVLSDHALRALYQSSTHYISMSLGEGWDLPMMEAAVAGCGLIAPRHSAYLAYLTDEEAELLPVRVEPAVFEGRTRREDAAWFAGLSWWRPDEDAAVDVVQQIVRGRARERPSPRERIASRYTWARAARGLLDALASDA